ncbi:hypothetical protein [Morganella psychrotolerans]|uniref:hypothetical protein n=1 Tax=Morganella psychrotolerans TaxID=368603 RepID=UPI0039B1271D
MLNKTKDTVFLSDNEIHTFDELYDENYLLSKYICRKNTDKLKETPWFKRKKKWNIPFRYHDLTIIRESIRRHPDNWVDYLADTIQLSESRYWIDWLITETYEYWLNNNHGDINVLKNKYHKYNTARNQLSALIMLYKKNVILIGENRITQMEQKLADCNNNLSRLRMDIDKLSQSVPFTQRDFYDALRAAIYHNNVLQHSAVPEELQTVIDSILLLKENNNNEFLHKWLYQRNICLRGDILHWY